MLENVPLALRQHMLFQHGGVPAYYPRSTRKYLDAKFPNKSIGRKDPCPARSPDSTIVVSFLLGYVKNFVYTEPPITRDEFILPFRFATPLFMHGTKPKLLSKMYYLYFQCCSRKRGRHTILLNLNGLLLTKI